MGGGSGQKEMGANEQEILKKIVWGLNASSKVLKSHRGTKKELQVSKVEMAGVSYEITSLVWKQYMLSKSRNNGINLLFRAVEVNIRVC